MLNKHIQKFYIFQHIFVTGQAIIEHFYRSNEYIKPKKIFEIDFFLYYIGLWLRS